MSAVAFASTRHTLLDTTLGELTLVRNDAGLTGLYYPGHWTQPDPQAFGPRTTPAEGGFEETAAQLADYLEGRRTGFDLPLDPQGSARARQLWRLLQEIPYGSLTTYGALAARLGGGISPRAVGGFVGRNPLSIVVPCHRVVGSTGALTGYAGGLARKQALLELEQALPAALVAR